MKRKKTLADVRPMPKEELEKEIVHLNPYIYDAIKDRLDEIPVHLQEALVQKIQIPTALMVKYNIPFNRHQMRELALKAIYQSILLGKDIRKALYDVLYGSNQVDGYLYDLAIGTMENRDEYEALISSRLRKDWPFERLPIIDQAILLMSTHEILEEDNPKAVIVNEAVTLAKKYSDEDSPNLINAILDSYGKDKSVTKEDEAKIDQTLDSISKSQENKEAYSKQNENLESLATNEPVCQNDEDGLVAEG